MRAESGSFAPTQRRVDITAALLWLGGVAVYHVIAKWAPQWGSALPTLALTFTLAWLTRPSESNFALRERT